MEHRVDDSLFIILGDPIEIGESIFIPVRTKKKTVCEKCGNVWKENNACFAYRRRGFWNDHEIVLCQKCARKVIDELIKKRCLLTGWFNNG